MEPVLTPSRLVLARARRGFTLAELERRSGVSTRSLTAYENAQQRPTAETLMRLASALQVPESFLPGSDLDAIPAAAASFRAASKMSATKRDAALAAGRIAISIQAWADEHFALPENQVPTLGRADPETAAETVRARWGLGESPVKNVVHTLEAHGVRIFSLASDCADVDAFSLYWHGTPFVFLNTMKSAERSRFDAAHELGHLVLHGENVPHGKQAEDDANRFAAAFLMPRRAVLARGLRNATVDRILDAKKVWKVAAMALTHRLRELGLLTEWGYRNACVSLSRMGYRRGEPDGIPRETSQALTKVLSTLRKEGMGAAAIAEAVGLTPDELALHLFGLTPTAIEGGRLPTSMASRPRLQLVIFPSTDEKEQPMAQKPPVHTVKHDDGWANRREGADRISKTFDTKAAAQAAGRETARREQTEHVIHKADGKIGQRNSYGKDPHPPRG